MRKHALVISGFALASLVWTWPAFISPLDTVPGGGGDSSFFLWEIWRSQSALEFGTNPLVTNVVMFPYEQPVVFHTHAILHAGLLYPVRALVGIVGVYNCWAFGSLVLGAWGAFLLANYLTGDWRAGVLAAFVFTFSPYRMAHLQGHLNLVSCHWIPFFLLFLLKALRGRRWHGWIAGFFLGLVCWSDLAYALQSTILALLILGWATARVKTVQPMLVGGRAVASMLVVISPLVGTVAAYSDHWNLSGEVAKPRFEEQRYFSARLVDFLLPPDLSPMSFPRISRNVERQTYLGISLVVLVWLAWRYRREQANDPWIWGVAALVMLVLSLGPYLRIADAHTLRFNGDSIYLPMPHLLLDQIPLINLSRCPARFVAMAMLCLGILAGFGLNYLRLRGHRWAPTFLLVLLAAEYFVIPYPVSDVRVPSDLGQTTRGSVIDIPLSVGSSVRRNGKVSHRSDLSQTVHQCPRIGGILARANDDVREQLSREPIISTLLSMSGKRLISRQDRIRDRDHRDEIVRRYWIRYALVQPGQVDHRAHRYLLNLFPESTETTLSNGAVWIELSKPMATASRRGELIYRSPRLQRCN